MPFIDLGAGGTAAVGAISAAQPEIGAAIEIINYAGDAVSAIGSAASTVGKALGITSSGPISLDDWLNKGGIQKQALDNMASQIASKLTTDKAKLTYNTFLNGDPAHNILPAPNFAGLLYSKMNSAEQAAVGGASWNAILGSLHNATHPSNPPNTIDAAKKAMLAMIAKQEQDKGIMPPAGMTDPVMQLTWLIGHAAANHTIPMNIGLTAIHTIAVSGNSNAVLGAQIGIASAKSEGIFHKFLRFLHLVN